jgi:hypothetical protein
MKKPQSGAINHLCETLKNPKLLYFFVFTSLGPFATYCGFPRNPIRTQKTLSTSQIG